MSVPLRCRALAAGVTSYYMIYQFAALRDDDSEATGSIASAVDLVVSAPASYVPPLASAETKDQFNLSSAGFALLGTNSKQSPASATSYAINVSSRAVNDRSADRRPTFPTTFSLEGTHAGSIVAPSGLFNGTTGLIKSPVSSEELVRKSNDTEVTVFPRGKIGSAVITRPPTTVAHTLQIAEGGKCHDQGDFPGQGCRLGCHCGTFQRCYEKVYDSHGDNRLQLRKPVDIGICRMAISWDVLALVLIATTCAAIIFGRVAVFRQHTHSPRAQLEKRLCEATSLRAQEREAILNKFYPEIKGETGDAPLSVGSEHVVNAAIALADKVATANRPPPRHSTRRQ